MKAAIGDLRPLKRCSLMKALSMHFTTDSATATMHWMAQSLPYTLHAFNSPSAGDLRCANSHGLQGQRAIDSKDSACFWWTLYAVVSFFAGQSAWLFLPLAKVLLFWSLRAP